MKARGHSPMLSRMKRTTACLVVHPRSGRNLARVPEVVAVLAAAGWTTDVVVKESKGQTLELAARAAEAGYDFVIAYGGDGTMNHVINGVLASAGHRETSVGVIPGGTANVWAAEVGIPTDPVRAARTLVESQVRTVDVGHVGVESLTLDGGASALDPESVQAPGARRHFLLMAGLGVDAALMGRTPAGLKHRLGIAAVALTALRQLPSLRRYPVGIRSGETDAPVWQGRALQLVVGNTRLYGKVARMTPDALLDSGELDLSVITARSRWSALRQVFTLLARGTPSHAHSKAARSARFRVNAPAWVGLQLDGSAVKLDKYLSLPGRDALGHAGDPAQVGVNYVFDAVPAALRIAIPPAYDGSLFRAGADSTPIDIRYERHDRSYRTSIWRHRVAGQPSSSILQGTLDLLVLKALALQELHGLGVARRVEQMTRGAYRVGPGSLFPALYRLEKAGAVLSHWGVSENNRRARFYRLTADGRAPARARDRRMEAHRGDDDPRAGGGVAACPRARGSRACSAARSGAGVQERALDDELDGYLAMLVDEKVRAGAPAGEARRAALMELGAPSG